MLALKGSVHWPGLIEDVYEEALEEELRLRGIRVERQLPVRIVHKGNEVGILNAKARRRRDAIGPEDVHALLRRTLEMDQPVAADRPGFPSAIPESDFRAFGLDDAPLIGGDADRAIDGALNRGSRIVLPATGMASTRSTIRFGAPAPPRHSRNLVHDLL